MSRAVVLIASILLATATLLGAERPNLERDFQEPPDSARPWVYWFWINGNISKEGITADLESFKRIGIGGVLWMEVSGPWWAPDGDVVPLSPQWHEAFQWAVSECARLGLQFDVTLDFGYGSGGPHITPELSMQKLVWSEHEVEGGQQIDIVLEEPHFGAVSAKSFPPGTSSDVVLKKGLTQEKTSVWLRSGAKIGDAVLRAIERSNSYKDVAVLAIPWPASQEGRDYRIADIDAKAGLHWILKKLPNAKPPSDAVTRIEQVMDLTAMMAKDGRLGWDAPPGKWLIIRYGHDTNLKMTRPCPAAAVGLDCDRLARAGIETHFDAFLRKVIEDAGPAAGRALAFAHIDSWEAGCQNWTATFPDEFHARRGYDLRSWLPVLTGRIVGSEEMSERFLWDLRTTVSEMIRDNYAGRLRELVHAYDMQLSIEAYGHLCIDSLAYAGISDMPMSEFWADGKEPFPRPGGYQPSSKAMASAAHIYGRPIIGAEAFTSGRGWQDHPFLLKAMGDKMFCEGVNRMVLCLSTHQPNDFKPGLTHRRWGEHFVRHNTWWKYSRPWMAYLSRCQYLLQQGQFVADVCYWVGEGAPIGVYDMTLKLDDGYDYDLCSSEMVLQMKVSNGRVVLPSGMSYRYLLLPASDRMTLPLARKVRELVDGGARVIGRQRPKSSPSLAGYPQCDVELEKIVAALWDTGRMISGKDLSEVFRQDELKPDFEGSGLVTIHRRAGKADIYFVSNQENRVRDITCRFRVCERSPELWDPETGAITELPEYSEEDGRTAVPLRFEPMQSWFVVFRENGDAIGGQSRKGFASPRLLCEITGRWHVAFDPAWGGPGEPVTFESLTDWSKYADDRIKYYSGTAVYRKAIEFSASEISGKNGRLLLDLGKVAVMASVKLNGKECGIAWKPPYLVDLSGSARVGQNELEIDVVNLWINRMIGDEQLPEDSKWKDYETLIEWPQWFKTGEPRPSGRYTFTTCKHYKKDSPLVPSGLIGPVSLKQQPTRP